MVSYLAIIAFFFIPAWAIVVSVLLVQGWRRMALIVGLGSVVVLFLPSTLAWLFYEPGMSDGTSEPPMSKEAATTLALFPGIFLAMIVFAMGATWASRGRRIQYPAT